MLQWILDFLLRGDTAGVAARATIAAAFVAFTGVALTTIVAFINARRSLYVSTVTAERSKWINSLRENISEFSGRLRTLSYKAIQPAGINPDEKNKIVSDVSKLISLIRLQLNPFGEIDQNIIQLLEKMPALAESPDNRVLIADELLIKHSQWLLKSEWEKVKYETRGAFLKLLGRFKARYRLRQYRAFAKNDGNLNKLNAERDPTPHIGT